MLYQPLLLLLALIAAFSVSRLDAAPVRVVGSDLLGGAIRDTLLAEAKKQGWDLSVDFTGSLGGQSALEGGKADIAILAIPEGAASPSAVHVVALAVHESNPIQEVSFATLAGLFGSGGEDFSRWGKLGATGSWQERQVSLNAVRNRQLLSLEIFRARVLGPRDLTGNVTYWEAPDRLLLHLATTPPDIALLPAGVSMPSGVRFLFIREEEGAASFRPTAQAVFYGDYPLQLPYFMYIRETSAPAREVIAFLLSDAVAEVLQKAHYMPLPETERRQFLAEFAAGE